MKTIGIDKDSHLVYEGSTFWGHGFWPAPLLLPTAIIDESADDFTPPNDSSGDYPPYMLLDDGYDPTSRIRRGKIYQKYQALQPYPWHVHPHPARPGDGQQIDDQGVIKRQLVTYCEFGFRSELQRLEMERPLIVLGSSTQFTIWSVIDLEASISGETILFLKARQTIGALPRVDYFKISNQHKKLIKAKLELLSEDLYRAGFDSIVDRAREAASAIVNAYLANNSPNDKQKDLGQLVIPLRDKAKKHIAANCVDTLAKLHSRTKYTEQQNKELRHNNSRDADFAVQSVSMLLREFDWVID